MKIIGYILLITFSLGNFQVLLAQKTIKTNKQVVTKPKKNSKNQSNINPEAILVTFVENTLAEAQTAFFRKFFLTKDIKVESPYFVRLIVSPKDRTISKVKQLVEKLKKEPIVKIAEPEMFHYLEDIPDDMNFTHQWSLDNLGTSGVVDADIDAPEAWETTTGNPSIRVAVIDTGVNVNHPDIQANILRDANGDVVGRNTLQNNSDIRDTHGHGTHVAGIIGAVGFNSQGISGVCPNVRIIPIKAFDPSLIITTTSSVLGIDFARVNNAKIINASYGDYRSESEQEKEAIQRAQAAGILFVASAGNESNNNDINPHYPSQFTKDFDNVISVAWTDYYDRLDSRSNTGFNSVDLAAPGVSILSLGLNNDYVYKDGSSMAAPHVSGAAALLLSAFPGLNGAQLKARLLNNVDRKSNLSNVVKTGGRLNVNRAILERNTFSIFGTVLRELYPIAGPPPYPKVRVGSMEVTINNRGEYRMFNLLPGNYVVHSEAFGRYIYPSGAQQLPNNVKITSESYELSIREDSPGQYKLPFKSQRSTDTYTASGRAIQDGVGVGNIQVEARAVAPFDLRQQTNETFGFTDSSMRLSMSLPRPEAQYFSASIRIPQNYLSVARVIFSYPGIGEPGGHEVPLRNLRGEYSNGVYFFSYEVPSIYRTSQLGNYRLRLNNVQGANAVIDSWQLAYRNIPNYAQTVRTSPDGTFTLKYLPATKYQLTATRNGTPCTPSGFSNPVTVGPNAGNINFVCN